MNRQASPRVVAGAARYQPHIALLNIGEDLVGTTRLLKTDSPNLHTVIPIHTRFGDPRVPDLAAEVEALGLGVSLLHPNIAETYWY